MVDKSYRGMLVEVIMKSFTKNYLFSVVDNMKEILQSKLDDEFKFETKVSDIQSIGNNIIGNISFMDENGRIRVLDFVITSNSIVV